MFKTEKPGTEIMDPIDEMDSDKPSRPVVLLQTLQKAKNETAELEMVVCKSFPKLSLHLKAEVWKILKRASEKISLIFVYPIISQNGICRHMDLRDSWEKRQWCSLMWQMSNLFNRLH